MAVSQIDGVQIPDFYEAMRDSLLSIFNETCMEFLQKLMGVFRRYRVQIEATLHEYNVALESGHETEPLLHFFQFCQPHAQKIADRDDKFIMENAKDLPMLKGADISQLWQKCPPPTRKAIWDYLQKLYATAAEFDHSCSLSKQTAGVDPQLFQDLVARAMNSVDKFLVDNGNRMPATQEELMSLVHQTYESAAADGVTPH